VNWRFWRKKPKPENETDPWYVITTPAGGFAYANASRPDGSHKRNRLLCFPSREMADSVILARMRAEFGDDLYIVKIPPCEVADADDLMFVSGISDGIVKGSTKP